MQPNDTSRFDLAQSVAVARPYRARAVLCAAGLVAALSCGAAITPAFADDPELADIGWDAASIAPAIDASEDVAPQTAETASPEAPAEQVATEAAVETPAEAPGVESDVPEVDSAADDVQYEYVPENESPAYPSYEEVYGGTSADAIGSSEGAFTEPEQVEQPQAEQVEEQAVVAGPAFSAFDAASGTVIGTAPAGSTVVLLDAGGNVVARTTASGDGRFWLVLSELPKSMESCSIAAFDESWAQLGEALPGWSFAGAVSESLAAQAQVRLAAIEAQIAQRPALGMATEGSVASGMPASDAEEGLPVLPYALGAASALLAIGAAAGIGGAALALRRKNEAGVADTVPMNEGAASAQVPLEDVPSIDAADDVPADIEGVVAEDAVAEDAAAERPAHFSLVEETAEAATRHDDSSVAQIEQFRSDPVDSVGPTDEIDELERVALAFAEACADDSSIEDGAPEDDWVDGQYEVVDEDDTMVMDKPLAPQDPAEFARMAKILASGTGTVHRVVAQTSAAHFGHGSVAEATASPDVEDDWCAIALRELSSSSDDESPASKTCPTADFATLTTGNFSIPDRAASTASYVAPVVGPRAVSDVDLERHMNYIDASNTGRIVALRERDDRFKISRTPQVVPVDGAQDASSTALWLLAAKRGLTSRWDSSRASADVPVISRGRANRVTVPEIETDTETFVSVSTPSPYGVAAAEAAVRYGMPDLAPNFGSDYAASIASNVYSDANITGSMSFPTGRPKVVSQVESSIAAAYAAAVYADVAASTQRAAAPLTGSPAGAPSSDNGRTEAMRSLDDSGIIDHSFSPSSLTSDYIDFMVQDEFEHRHETAAQRNAAIGALHVVNGSASSPVPLDAGLSHLRHRA